MIVSSGFFYAVFFLEHRVPQRNHSVSQSFLNDKSFISATFLDNVFTMTASAGGSNRDAAALQKCQALYMVTFHRCAPRDDGANWPSFDHNEFPSA